MIYKDVYFCDSALSSKKKLLWKVGQLAPTIPHGEKSKMLTEYNSQENSRLP